MKDMVGSGPFGLKAGEWTDDTSMALCLAESLIEKRGFDPADQLRKYVRWHREGHMSATGECFDIGGATREALERFEKTGDPYSGSTDPGRAGNGSLMRLAPAPLFYAGAPDYPFEDVPLEAVERSGESSRTTHGARTAVDACRYMGALIMGAVNGAEKDELLSERYYPISGRYWEDYPLVPEVDDVATGSFKRREPPEIRGRGYVVASLEAALWAFHNSGSFEEGCLLAVNLGEDADTTGAIYGQLAGAFYGERGIPEHWRRRLAHRLLIEHFAERLYHLGKTVDWEKLLEFLPIFERLGFVPDVGNDPLESFGAGAGQEMIRFNETLYETGAIYRFAWMDWHDEAGRFFQDPALLESADEMTLRKLLTYHSRADRFNEGHLDDIIEAGYITRILRVLRELKTG
jgi:ADP-ribosyl-[dinitrogen reductase] hydrolase